MLQSVLFSEHCPAVSFHTAFLKAFSTSCPCTHYPLYLSILSPSPFIPPILASLYVFTTLDFIFSFFLLFSFPSLPILSLFPCISVLTVPHPLCRLACHWLGRPGWPWTNDILACPSWMLGLLTYGWNWSFSSHLYFVCKFYYISKKKKTCFCFPICCHLNFNKCF